MYNTLFARITRMPLLHVVLVWSLVLSMSVPSVQVFAAADRHMRSGNPVAADQLAAAHRADQSDSASPAREQEHAGAGVDPSSAVGSSRSGDVNLLSGKVKFSIPLGKAGDYNFAVHYSSNLVGGVDRINKEVPAGVLGLGWSMARSRIVRVNWRTSNFFDDQIYLVFNGQSYALQMAEVDAAGVETYYTPVHRFFQARHDPRHHRWEVSWGNGKTYVFGDSRIANNALEEVIAWDNWIGPATFPEGRTNVPVTYNLSAIVDRFGSSTNFSYIQERQEVAGSSTITYTRAAYLNGVVAPDGEAFQFVYADKDATEYTDPYQYHAEPDSFQERFETKYLSEMRHLTASAGGEVVRSIVFSYRLFNPVILPPESKVPLPTVFNKRLLTAITMYEGERAVQQSPPHLFSYWDREADSDLSIEYDPDKEKYTYNLYSEQSGGYLGALKSRTIPGGAKISYAYAKRPVGGKYVYEHDDIVDLAMSRQNVGTIWTGFGAKAVVEIGSWDGDFHSYRAEVPIVFKKSPIGGMIYTTDSFVLAYNQFGEDNHIYLFMQDVVDGSWMEQVLELPSTAVTSKNGWVRMHATKDMIVAQSNHDPWGLYVWSWEGERGVKSVRPKRLEIERPEGATLNGMAMAGTASYVGQGMILNAKPKGESGVKEAKEYFALAMIVYRGLDGEPQLKQLPAKSFRAEVSEPTFKVRMAAASTTMGFLATIQESKQSPYSRHFYQYLAAWDQEFNFSILTDLSQYDSEEEHEGAPRASASDSQIYLSEYYVSEMHGGVFVHGLIRVYSYDAGKKTWWLVAGEPSAPHIPAELGGNMFSYYVYNGYDSNILEVWDFDPYSRNWENTIQEVFEDISLSELDKLYLEQEMLDAFVALISILISALLSLIDPMAGVFAAIIIAGAQMGMDHIFVKKIQSLEAGSYGGISNSSGWGDYLATAESIYYRYTGFARTKVGGTPYRTAVTGDRYMMFYKSRDSHLVRVLLKNGRVHDETDVHDLLQGVHLNMYAGEVLSVQRIIYDRESLDAPVDYTVKTVTVDTGHGGYSRTADYMFSGGGMDASGANVYYRQADVSYQNSNSRERFLYYGKDFAAGAPVPEFSSNGGAVQKYPGKRVPHVLQGKLYAQDIYRGNETAYSLKYGYRLNLWDMPENLWKTPVQYATVSTRKEVLHGVSKITEYVYNDYGQSQLVSAQTFYPGADGETDNALIYERSLGYAWEENEAMREQRLFKDVARMDKYVREGGNSVRKHTGSKRIAYKQWDPARPASWQAEKQWSALNPDAAFSEGSAEWVLESENLDRAPDGTVLRTAGNAQLSRTLYAEAPRLAYGLFQRGFATDEERDANDLLYLGFESYEKVSGWQLQGEVAEQAGGYFGHALEGEKGGGIQLKNEDFEAQPGVSYVVSAWVRGSGAAGEEATLGFGPGREKKVPLTQQWQYAEYVWKPADPGERAGAAVEIAVSPGGAVDDVVVRPQAAKFSAMVWDVKNRQVISTLASDSFSRAFNLYDRQRRVPAVWHQPDRLPYLGVPQWSLDPSLMTPEHPGRRTTITFEGERSRWGRTPADSPVSENYSIYEESDAWDGVAFHLDLLNPETDWSTSVQMGTYSIYSVPPQGGLKGMLVLYRGSRRLQEYSLPGDRTAVEKFNCFLRAGRLLCYVDGDLAFAANLDAQDSGSSLSFTGQFRYFLAGESPRITHIYLDGLGRSLQSSRVAYAADGSLSDSIAHGVVYDGYGRKTAASLGVRYHLGSSETPVENIASLYKENLGKFDWGGKELNGDVSTQYKDGYAYTGNFYNDAPYRELGQQTFSDSQYRYGSVNAQRYEYGESDGGKYYRNSLVVRAGTTNVATVTYANNNRQPVKKVSGGGRLSENIPAYFTAGRSQHLEYLPDYYADRRRATLRVLSLLDARGRLHVNSHPDAGDSFKAMTNMGKVLVESDGASRDAQSGRLRMRYYTRDGLGRLLSESALEVAASGSYPDPDSEFIRNLDYRGISPRGDAFTEYAYNAHNRISGRVRYYRGEGSAGSVRESFSYDVFGYPETDTLQVQKPDDSTSRSFTVGYEYSRSGKLRKLKYPSGLEVSYDYDDLGRLNRIYSKDEVYASDFNYNTEGVLVSHQLNDRQLEWRNSQDRRQYVRMLRYSVAGGEPLFEEGLRWQDAQGNSVRNLVAGRTFSGSGFGAAQQVDYIYDGSGWLLGTTQGGKQYSYDANGNRLGGYGYYEGTDRLAVTLPSPGGEGAAAHRTYDGRGSTVAALTPSGQYTFTYDNEDGLVSEVALDGLSRRYMRGAQRNKVLSSSSAGEDRYHIYGHGGRILEEWTYGSEEGELLRRKVFVHGMSRMLFYNNTELQKEEEQQSGAWYLVHDTLGSVRQIISAADNLVAGTYDYTVWGETEFTARLPGFSTPPGYAFIGHEYDAQLRLYDFGARLYEPYTGRFLQVDIRPQAASPYVYAANNPVNFVDYTGHMIVVPLVITSIEHQGNVNLAASVMSQYREAALQAVYKPSLSGEAILQTPAADSGKGLVRVNISAGDEVQAGNHIFFDALHGTENGGGAIDVIVPGGGELVTLPFTPEEMYKFAAEAISESVSLASEGGAELSFSKITITSCYSGRYLDQYASVLMRTMKPEFRSMFQDVELSAPTGAFQPLNSSSGSGEIGGFASVDFYGPGGPHPNDVKWFFTAEQKNGRFGTIAARWRTGGNYPSFSTQAEAVEGRRNVGRFFRRGEVTGTDTALPDGFRTVRMGDFTPPPLPPELPAGLPAEGGDFLGDAAGAVGTVLK